MGARMRWWLKVRQMGRDAVKAKSQTGNHAIVRLEKREASEADVARAARHIMREHRAALKWLADK